MAFAILDKSIAAIRASLPRFSVGELEALKEAEEAGKTRKGAIEAIEEALAEAEEPEPDPGIITNCVPGTELWLGDGRKLRFGETATTTPAEAAFLRGRGQVA